jgi:ferredoxin
MHMKLCAPNSATVRLAEGQPVIRDITAASVPERFRGRPKLDSSRCAEGCSACVDVCPTHAVSLNPLTIDLGACVFCPLCTEACPEGAISYTNDYKIAATSRAGLLLREGGEISPEGCAQEIQRLFGRSLKLRSVSAGGCNGCELELNALGNPEIWSRRWRLPMKLYPRQN